MHVLKPIVVNPPPDIKQHLLTSKTNSAHHLRIQENRSWWAIPGTKNVIIYCLFLREMGHVVEVSCGPLSNDVSNIQLPRYLIVNIALRRLLHNNGNIANVFNWFCIVRSALIIDSTAHSRLLYSLEHCICKYDSNPVLLIFEPQPVRMSHRGRPTTRGNRAGHNVLSDLVSQPTPDFDLMKPMLH